jgi:hypothetical protein
LNLSLLRQLTTIRTNSETQTKRQKVNHLTPIALGEFKQPSVIPRPPV